LLLAFFGIGSLLQERIFVGYDSIFSAVMRVYGSAANDIVCSRVNCSLLGG
jgi:hypothetical protein